MKTYEFSIIASGLDPRAEGFDSRFYEKGCDDALVSFSKTELLSRNQRDPPPFSTINSTPAAVECVDIFTDANCNSGAVFERKERA
jgi:hypothetical protein